MKTRSLAPFCLALVVSGTTGASAKLEKQLTLEPNQDITFFMGTQTGTATFTPKSGACELTLTISATAQSSISGMSGMSGGMAGMAAIFGTKSPTLKLQVAPERPASLEAPVGGKLVFNCQPDGQKMFLDMPSEMKHSVK